MRYLILFILLAAGTLSYAQDQSIGVRIGNPMGVTYKRYFSSGKAIEFGIGSASPGWNGPYYSNAFGRRNDYDDFKYLSHTVKSTLYLQGRYLLQYDIPVQNMEGKLQWYWGAGAVIKIAKVRYRYESEVDPDGQFADEKIDFDFGPEGIAGMEYTFEDLPLTLFGEVSLMLELVDRPGVRAFGGTGARYRF